MNQPYDIYIKYMKYTMLVSDQAQEYGNTIDDTAPKLDHVGTCTFTFTDRAYGFPLEEYGPTAYIQLRLPSDK